MAEEPYDLSEFIMGGKGGEGCKTLLISDFEGTTPTAHFKKFKEYCKGEDGKRVIFLGDVFDNTAQFGPYCNGNECLDPDEEYGNCVSDKNYCALQTIKTLVDDEQTNCRYVVGNRDVNKIKLLPFFYFKDTNMRKWWKGYNNPEDNTIVTFKSYEEIVKNLLTTLKSSENKWMIQGDDIKYFRPFWNNDKYGEAWTNQKSNITDIYERFELMFGKDPTKGTMSALATLKCIPNEMFGAEGMLDFYKKIKGDENYAISEYPSLFKQKLETKDANKKKEIEELINNNSKEMENKLSEFNRDVTWRKQVRAALTITIFMRMLEKVEHFEPNKTTDNFNQLGDLDGYLHHYLTKAPAAYYATHKDDLFLFAHGGITEAFIEKKGMQGITNVTLNKFKWNEKIKPKEKSKGGKRLSMKGGAQEIKESINNYNNAYFELINNFFDKLFFTVLNISKSDDEERYAKPKKDWVSTMLSLLKLSAGTISDSNKFPNDSTVFYPNQTKEPSDSIFDKYHPVGNVYNIFGHASASSFYSFGKARVKEKDSKKKMEMGSIVKDSNGNDTRTYFLSTDFSTTLFKDGIICMKYEEETGIKNEYDDNYLLCILDTTNNLKLTMEGVIKLSNKGYDIKPYEKFDEIDGLILAADEPTIFFPPNDKNVNRKYNRENIAAISFQFDANANLITDIDGIDASNTTKFLIFNGIAKMNNETYNIYSNRWADVDTGEKDDKGEAIKKKLKYSIVLVRISEEFVPQEVNKKGTLMENPGYEGVNNSDAVYEEPINVNSEYAEVSDFEGGRPQLKKRHRRKTKKSGKKTHKRRAAKKRATKKKSGRRKTKRMH